MKSVVEISDELNRYPDCYARNHKSSLMLHEYEERGREDLRLFVKCPGRSYRYGFDRIQPHV